MKRFLLVSSLLIIAVALSACGQASAQTPVAVDPSSTTAPQSDPAPEPTATPVPATEMPVVPTAGSASSTVSFANNVLPILNSRCASCHGVEDVKAGLDVRTYAALMRGSQDGAVVTAGDAANSPLYSLSASGKMPKRGPKLTPDQVQTLMNWINQGALDN